MVDAASPGISKQAAAGLAVGGLTLLGLWAFGPDWRIAGGLALLASGGAAAWWTFAAPGRWLPAFIVLTLLTPPLGDSGLHPAMFAGALGLAELSRLRYRTTSFGAAAVWLLTMMMLSLGPALTGAGWATTAQSFVRCGLFAVAVAAYFAARDCVDARNSLRLLAAATGLLALLSCVDFLLQWPALAPFSPQYAWTEADRLRRAQAFFYDSGQLGSYCVFGLLGSLLLLTRPTARRALGVSRTWLGVGALLLSAALVFSHSRAALLALGAGVLVIVVQLDRPAWNGAWGRGALAAGAALVGGAASAYIAAPSYAHSYVTRLAKSIELAITNPVLAIGDRWESWAHLTDYLGRHPGDLLLGVGYKTLPHSDVVGRPVIADNMYLSLLVETGLGGLLALLALVAAAWLTGLRGARSSDALTSCLGVWTTALWTATAVQMLWVDLLTYWRVLPIYFMVVALLERRLNEDTPCAS